MSAQNKNRSDEDEWGPLPFDNIMVTTCAPIVDKPSLAPIMDGIPQPRNSIQRFLLAPFCRSEPESEFFSDSSTESICSETPEDSSYTDDESASFSTRDTAWREYIDGCRFQRQWKWAWRNYIVSFSKNITPAERFDVEYVAAGLIQAQWRKYQYISQEQLFSSMTTIESCDWLDLATRKKTTNPDTTTSSAPSSHQRVKSLDSGMCFINADGEFMSQKEIFDKDGFSGMISSAKTTDENSPKIPTGETSGNVNRSQLVKNAIDTIAKNEPWSQVPVKLLPKAPLERSHSGNSNCSSKPPLSPGGRSLNECYMSLVRPRTPPPPIVKRHYVDCTSSVIMPQINPHPNLPSLGTPTTQLVSLLKVAASENLSAQMSTIEKPLLARRSCSAETIPKPASLSKQQRRYSLDDQDRHHLAVHASGLPLHPRSFSPNRDICSVSKTRNEVIDTIMYDVVHDELPAAVVESKPEKGFCEVHQPEKEYSTRVGMNFTWDQFQGRITKNSLEWVVIDGEDGIELQANV